jgi:hypothetical protein
MATKKRPVPPKPSPKPKPVSPKPKPKPNSGGFGRLEDQIVKAAADYINTAGTGIRGAATGVDKLVVGIGKAISSAFSGGAAPGTFMGPAPKPKPKPKPNNSTPIQGGYLQREYPGEPWSPKRNRPKPVITPKPKIPKSL